MCPQSKHALFPNFHQNLSNIYAVRLWLVATLYVLGSPKSGVRLSTFACAGIACCKKITSPVPWQSTCLRPIPVSRDNSTTVYRWDRGSVVFSIYGRRSPTILNRIPRGCLHPRIEGEIIQFLFQNSTVSSISHVLPPVVFPCRFRQANWLAISSCLLSKRKSVRETQTEEYKMFIADNWHSIWSWIVFLTSICLRLFLDLVCARSLCLNEHMASVEMNLYYQSHPLLVFAGTFFCSLLAYSYTN